MSGRNLILWQGIFFFHSNCQVWNCLASKWRRAADSMPVAKHKTTVSSTTTRQKRWFQEYFISVHLDCQHMIVRDFGVESGWCLSCFFLMSQMSSFRGRKCFLKGYCREWKIYFPFKHNLKIFAKPRNNSRACEVAIQSIHFNCFVMLKLYSLSSWAFFFYCTMFSMHL